MEKKIVIKENFYKPTSKDIIRKFLIQYDIFNRTRHELSKSEIADISKSWRIRDRMKTVSVALVVCLNVGVDPPDIFKITPCSRLECWIDPSSMSPQKALELIGANLQKQYERWQPRARYKQSLDPTVEDVKKLCISLRRNAKEERVLFHYNGHGVPRPTGNGEIWVFNRTYTQYIPLSIYDLQTWMGSPSIYVYDCSNAGIIVKSFSQFAEQHEREMEQMASSNGNLNAAAGQQTCYSFRNCIQLAACGEDQILPMNPQLPADLFTACLTTPIKIALKWFMLQKTSLLVPHLSHDLIDRIPGQLNDRRTMLGELNWIFTAITDTIAWNTLPRDLFQRLFRQDLLVASLFRNFLLAERIMRSYDCTPVSNPQIPNGYRHHMWQAWDLAIDLALQQLPDIVERNVPYQNSPFFEDQLTAFHVWLEHSAPLERGSEEREPPEQLPIVLQVLLSQVHRLRALELLGRFLDLGPWAVNLALSVGIFPYVLKLLQASAKELRPLLVFIWAKILAVDVTCQVDLVCEQGQKYFLSVLQDPSITPKYRTLAAFVLASIVHNFPLGQANALQGSLISICLIQICDDECHTLRQWLAICLGHLWQNYDKARWSGVRDNAHEKLYILLQDKVPEVRAAAVYALGTFISSQQKDRTEHANNIDRQIALTLFTTVGNDMSPIVRMELLAAMQWIVMLFLNVFMAASTQDTSAHNNFHTHSLERTVNMKRVSSSSSILNMPGSGSLNSFSALGLNSIYIKLWRGLLAFCHDPCPEVVKMAKEIVMYIIVDLNTAKEAEKEMFSSSVSLPPSPNTRTNYLRGNSPPVSNNINLSWHQIESSGANIAQKRVSRSTTPIQDRLESRSRKNSRNYPPTETEVVDGNTTAASISNADINVTSASSIGDENQDPSKPKPIVTTNYIAWSTSNVTNTGENKPKKYFTKQRSKLLEQKVRDIEYTMQNGNSSLYLSQSWGAKTQNIPNLIRFHPIEEQIAVAYRDKVMVNDKITKTVQPYAPEDVTSNIPILSRSPSKSEVTSFEFINPSNQTLLLVGHDDGCIRVWKPPTDSNEKPNLVTGWQAVNDVTANRMINQCGLIAMYQAANNVIVTGSVGKSIRFWDPETERKIAEIATDNESAVRVLSSSNEGLTIVGFDDGCCQVIDKRTQAATSTVRTYREHNERLLECCMISETGTLFTGSQSGDCVCIDFRKNRVIERWKTNRESTAIAVYPYSNIVAIGSESTITLYHYNGQELHRSRGGNESGYRGMRNAHISCLSFHPLRGNIATGYTDNLVTVYDIFDKNTKPISYYW